jgi:hypothetical protein
MQKEGAMTARANGTTEGMEEGEEPTFPLVEETRQGSVLLLF